MDQVSRPAAKLPSWSADGSQRRSLHRYLLAAMFLASLWLKAAIPLLAIPAAGHDDGLYVQIARSLLAGDWLGPYDERTLVKGMGYPLFIAFCHLTGVPLKLAEHLLYLGAGLLLANLCGRLLRSPRTAVVIFALIAFNPAPFLPDMARVLREALYVSLGMLVLATAGHAYLLDAGMSRRRLGRSAWLVALGLALAFFWLTREEREWILPALAMMVGYGLWRSWSRGRRAISAVERRSSLAAGLAAILIPLGIFVFILGGVHALNWRVYGVFRDNDLQSAAFESAFGALWRIEAEPREPFAVFPAPARQAAYAASPAAAELKPYLDGAASAVWQEASCAAIKLCREIPATWFVWALRDAAARASHHRSAREADLYYERLAREIDLACREGRLACAPPHAGLAPPFSRSDLARLPESLLEAYSIFAEFDGRQIELPQSQGESLMIANFRQITGGETAPLPAGLRLKGWVYSAAGRPSLALAAGGSLRSATDISLAPAADVLRARPAASAQALRFRLETDCLREGCAIWILREGRPEATLPLAEAHVGLALDQADAMLYIDEITPAETVAQTAPERLIQLRILNRLCRIYKAALPLALPAAAVALIFILGADSRQRRRTPGSIFAAALLVAVLMRLLLFAYLYASFSPLYELRYFVPAYPLALAFIGMVACDVLSRLRRSPA